MHTFWTLLILVVGGSAYLLWMAAMLYDAACCRRNIREMEAYAARRDDVLSPFQE